MFRNIIVKNNMFLKFFGTLLRMTAIGKSFIWDIPELSTWYNGEIVEENWLKCLKIRRKNDLRGQHYVLKFCHSQLTVFWSRPSARYFSNSYQQGRIWSDLGQIFWANYLFEKVFSYSNPVILIAENVQIKMSYILKSIAENNLESLQKKSFSKEFWYIVVKHYSMP